MLKSQRVPFPICALLVILGILELLKMYAICVGSVTAGSGLVGTCILGTAGFGIFLARKVEHSNSKPKSIAYGILYWAIILLGIWLAAVFTGGLLSP